MAEADIDPLVGDELGDRRLSQRLHMDEDVGLALPFAHEAETAGAVEPFYARPDPAARRRNVDMRPVWTLHGVDSRRSIHRQDPQALVALLPLDRLANDTRSLERR